MPVRSLRIKHLGPFHDIQFDFDRRVNVLIGPNNCGKSTVLMGLAEAIVCPFTAPIRLYRGSNKPELTISLCDKAEGIKLTLPWQVDPKAVDLMRRLGYTGFVPALRENTGFRPRSPMGEGTTEPRGIKRTGTAKPLLELAALEEEIYRKQLIQYRAQLTQSAERTTEDSKLSEADRDELRKRDWATDPSRITDQAVVSKIVELDYRAYRKNDPRFRKIVEVVATIGTEIMTGFPLDFLGIEEDDRGLYPQFRTPDGALPLDKLSQGSQSVIQWLSHLILGMGQYYGFPPDLTDKPAVFIIDEVDAHMHPEWQRRIIPTIIKTLPHCQLFASTHSPLVLSGLAEGQVQLLSRDENNRVVVSANDEDTAGWSIDEIMRWLMGMRGTFDGKTEEAVSDLMQLRDKNNLTESERAQLETLRNEIHSRLLRKKTATTKPKRAERA